MVWKTKVQSQVELFQRLKKWYLMVPCLTLTIYKVRIRGKVEQSRERSSAVGAVAIEKETFGSPSTKFANFTYYLWMSANSPL